MSIGSELTAARERADMTVEQLSASTRIRSGLLTAMEADDFTRCGGNFYARGHIRSIARVVKADPEALLAKFDETHPAPQPDRSRREERAKSKRPALHPARPRWAVVLGAILVGLMGWGMVRLFTLPSDVEAKASKTTPTVAVTTPAPKPPAKPTAKPTAPAKPTKPAAPLRTKLTLTARGDGSYVTIRNSKGIRLFQGVLGPGSSQTVNYSGEIRVTLESGSNITVFINGAKATPPSKRFTILPTGKIATPED